MKKLIYFLVRKKLGLKKGQHFKFANQVSQTDWYMFTDTGLMKIYHFGCNIKPSSVSLNWLLNDECEIIKMENN